MYPDPNPQSNPAALSLLMHLADSAVPIGGYAFSQGLESAAKMGMLQTLPEAEAYITTYVHQLGRSELPFLNSCYALPTPEPDDELRPIVTQYDAWLTVPHLRHASISQGGNWLRMVAALLPECGTDDILRWHERHGFDTHFTVVFALSMKRTDATIDETRTLYLYMAARDQVCAAIRLGLLGPQHAHRLLHTVYCDPHIMNFHPDAGYQDACKTAPMIDVAQANHVHVYAKLFQT